MSLYKNSLLPYQVDGVKFLADSEASLLLDEQGLGKTVQAIRAADVVGAKRVRVICPAIARGMWKQAFDEWAITRHELEITSYDFWSRGGAVNPLEGDFDVLILDEAHYLKGFSSKRTATIYGKYCRRGPDSVAGRAKRVWALSGTITPNGPHEIYTHLRALRPDLISVDGRPRTEFEFIQRYCTWITDSRGNVKVTGVNRATLPELKAILKQFTLRRTKARVLTSLPPIRFEVVPMSGEGLRVHQEYERHLKIALDAIQNDEVVEGIPPTVRRLTGQAKANAAAEWVRMKLDGGCAKIVVFAYHRAVIAQLVRELRDYNAVVVSGVTADHKRQANIKRFQTDPECRVFIGQITATGTAVTLTAASDVAFVEASWVPADNEQAAARCHRIGQRDSVLVSFLTLEGSIDEAIQRTLVKKMKNLALIWAEEA